MSRFEISDPRVALVRPDGEVLYPIKFKLEAHNRVTIHLACVRVAAQDFSIEDALAAALDEDGGVDVAALREVLTRCPVQHSKWMH